MIVLFDYFIRGFLVTSFMSLYASSKLLKEKINYKSVKFWGIVVINFIILTILYEASDSIIRVIGYYLILTVINKFLYNKNFMTSFLATFATCILFVVAEVVYAIIAVLALNLDVEKLKDMFFASLIGNVVISAIVFMLVNFKRIRAFGNSMVSNNGKMNKNYIIYLALALVTLTIILYFIYFDTDLITGLVLNLILIVAYMLIIINLFKEKKYNMRLQSKYKTLINSFNEYEKMLEIQRINNHENQNHLIVIKDMVSKHNKKVRNYIDKLLMDTPKGDSSLLFKIAKLPVGGLQGLIYQKLLIMKEKKIDANLEIAKDLNVEDFDKIDNDINYHLCTIIGVQLDNSIEAVMNLEEKIISIYVYKEKDFINIAISNNFEGKLDLNHIDDKGYSTKGKGRGYGLSLVREILEKDTNLTLKREVNSNIFKQILKIKI